MELYKETDTTRMIDKYNKFWFLCCCPDFWVKKVDYSDSFTRIYRPSMLVNHLVMLIFCSSCFLSLWTQHDLTQSQNSDRLAYAASTPVIIILYHFVILYYTEDVKQVLYKLAVVLKVDHNDKKAEEDMIKQSKLHNGIFFSSCVCNMVFVGLNNFYRAVTTGRKYFIQNKIVENKFYRCYVFVAKLLHLRSTRSRILRLCSTDYPATLFVVKNFIYYKRRTDTFDMGILPTFCYVVYYVTFLRNIQVYSDRLEDNDIYLSHIYLLLFLFFCFCLPDATFITCISAWPDIEDRSTLAGLTRVVVYFVWFSHVVRNMGVFLIIHTVLLLLSQQYKNLQSYFEDLNKIFLEKELTQEEQELKFEVRFKKGIEQHALTLW